MPWSIRRSRADGPTRRFLVGLLGATLAIEALLVPVAAVGADPAAANANEQIEPGVHYADAQAHANDRIRFAPGGRVTVGFDPRRGDRFTVGGEAPRGLPAGRLSGRALRDAATTPAIADPTPTATAATATAAPTATPSTSVPPVATPVPPALDQPIVDPAAAIDAIGSSFRGTAATDPDAVELQAAVSPAGLRREIFGFLPYWELNSSTVLDYAKLSTIAYFGVGASAAGNLEKTSKDGSTTVGWSGWTSSRMTDLINDAHRNSTRIVLTVQSFAWSSAGATKQKALLGSSTARANLARQIAAAVRDRGADGVNLDFEPVSSGYADAFTSLVRRVRTELDAVHKGYQLTFDTTGYIGNYPIEAATATGGADAIFIMGYDYRNGSSATAGSVAPIGGPAYDITDTIAAYVARVPASKLILGVPYYGRAWSTDTDLLNARNISGTKYGASATVIYSTAVGHLVDHGPRYDTREGVAWTAYRRENCTATYGCVTSWRQLYVDDAQALKAKYDLVNRYGLRGAGIWALGYDGSRPELWTAIRDKFITDTTAPRAGIRLLAAVQTSEAFEVGWVSGDDFGVASHDVDVSIDGGSWSRWLSTTTADSATYTGARGHAFAFRVRARDGKGNLSDWGGMPLAGAAPRIAVGGFGRVVTDTLNARSGPGTTSAIVATLGTGDRVAFLEGPIAADGYTWFRVAAPLVSWPVVGGTRTDLWIATGGGADAFVAAIAPPNTASVSASAALASAGGATWHPISPVRLLDTRTGNGLSGSFVTRSPRSFGLAGRGSVPVDAVAVTANLTVTGPTSAGYVAIGPSMTASPTTSTINVARGQTIANGITLRIGAGGTVGAVFIGASGARAHVVLDVTGYYRAEPGATWYPLKPVRLLDTRTGNGLAGSFRAKAVRTFQVSGRGSIPTDAIAVSGNLTATGATASGFVTLGPAVTSSPPTSTLNLVRGRTIANQVTARLAPGGKLSAVFVSVSGARVNLVFDVTGYYRAGAGGATWHPISPVRLLDTRTGNGLSGSFVTRSPRSFGLAGRGSVPVDAVAVTANLTVTGPTSAGYVAIGPSMTASPTTSTINVARGQTIANGITLRIGAGGTVGAVFIGASGARAHEIVDLTGYFR